MFSERGLLSPALAAPWGGSGGSGGRCMPVPGTARPAPGSAHEEPSRGFYFPTAQEMCPYLGVIVRMQPGTPSHLCFVVTPPPPQVPKSPESVTQSPPSSIAATSTSVEMQQHPGVQGGPGAGKGM